ncbi:ClpXP protease specificity-enhancing factor SspB [Azospirillum formosense]|uniref:SspB family protein n=1 Tax=Azospirillum formosense TaxID=861533 RepID=UPI00338E05EB
MPREQLRYDRMVEAALRGVVRDALRQVTDRGLPGDHHFYLTFRTGYPGVDIPEYLSSQYPNEMTIVIQYQFYGLEALDDHFEVTLSFNNVHERLVIPYAAITTFADPSENFALQFQPVEPAESADVATIPGREAPERKASDGTKPSIAKLAKSDSAKPDSARADAGKPDSDRSGEEPKRGEVVALDAFRKK